MAETKWEHALQVPEPDTLASEAKDDGGIQDPAAKEPPLGRCFKAIVWLVGALVVVIVVSMIITRALDGAPTEYSAAITGAAVPDKQQQAPNAIPALFSLTVHMKNPSRLSARCLCSGATAMVSYFDGAAIAAGTVPWLCAGKREESEVTVPVWGMGAGADASLPRALQSRGAVVNVSVRMPRSNAVCESDKQVTCSVEVGGGRSLCTSEYY